MPIFCQQLVFMLNIDRDIKVGYYVMLCNVYYPYITCINPIEYSIQIEMTEVTNIIRLHWIKARCSYYLWQGKGN